MAIDYEAVTQWQDYGLDHQLRRVMLHNPIRAAEDTYEIGVDHVIRNILHLDAVEVSQIELWINSPGGDIYEMWGVHDVMRAVKSPVVTVGFGNIASAACLLLAAGTGPRYVMPNASFMWHQGTTGCFEHLNHLDNQQRAAWEDREFKRWVGAMTRYTAKPKTYKFWEAASKGELWMDAEEMVKAGVADQIMDHL